MLDVGFRHAPVARADHCTGPRLAHPVSGGRLPIRQ
jgi:hypothetical protein